ncbi:uncharacterized protein METZ01_LOCUS6439, partial [marine metagenome]|tara:strand:- start:225 stop:860 length:636 start_codon:yes stop_codon:yes gene_type:complete
VVTVLLIGLSLGFFGSVPLAGPIAVLVFAYGLEGQFRTAIFLSLGAALAEAIYAYAAFWGVDTLFEHYPSITLAANGVIGLLLIGVGIALTRRELSLGVEKTTNTHHARALTLGFTIAMLNPTLLVTWSTVMAALHSTGFVGTATEAAIPFAIGVIGGIVGWFSLLLLLIRKYSGHFTTKFLNRVVNSMAVVLMLIGGWFLAEPIHHLIAL